MEKETVLAKLRGTIDFTDQGREWLKTRDDAWYAKEEGDAFLGEFRGRYIQSFESVTEKVVSSYFVELGISENHLPKVKILETYRGSIIIEAAITIAGSMGLAYAVLKGLAELPKIADGLEDLKKRIKKVFGKKTEQDTRQILCDQQENPNRVDLPPNILSIDFTIDARPIRSLQPDQGKDHKIHLSVSISRSVFVLENLGQEDMRDIRVGIFSSSSRRNQWSFTDSYSGAVTLLSVSQTISKSLDDFEDHSRNKLDLSGSMPLYVDCWIQDESGIYLFNFYLD